MSAPVSMPRRASSSSNTLKSSSTTRARSQRRTSVSASLKAASYVETDDEEPWAADGEIKLSKLATAAKGSKKVKAAASDAVQCEICAKWYRHMTCLIKHRWEHTEQWISASSLVTTKHQSVAMLEAAAILTSGRSLPDEKAFWPAAVSPPSSGLLGSQFLNTAVIHSLHHSSFGASSLPLTATTTTEELSARDYSPESEPATIFPDSQMIEDEDEGVFEMEEVEASLPVAAFPEQSAPSVRASPPLRPSGATVAYSAPTLGFFGLQKGQPARIISHSKSRDVAKHTVEDMEL